LKQATGKFGSSTAKVLPHKKRKNGRNVVAHLYLEGRIDRWEAFLLGHPDYDDTQQAQEKVAFARRMAAGIVMILQQWPDIYPRDAELFLRSNTGQAGERIRAVVTVSRGLFRTKPVRRRFIERGGVAVPVHREAGGFQGDDVVLSSGVCCKTFL
jgi:hypothetical protein